MENLVETVLQYGIAGAALLMMYTIAYHHLTIFYCLQSSSEPSVISSMRLQKVHQITLMKRGILAMMHVRFIFSPPWAYPCDKQSSYTLSI